MLVLEFGFFFKQKTAYEMRISDWSSDVCSSDLCDPLCENFLDDGRRMWIVDWEYSGMNDPLWDLGDVSVEAGFDAAQDRERSEECRGGNECVSTCRSRWLP